MSKFIAFARACKAAIDIYLEQEEQAVCLHNWQPARTSLGPARHCRLCELTEQLTTEMYYAQFGKMPHMWY